MSKPGGHKKQHYIPKVYLAAWCDPDTPSQMQPYVWVFDRAGGLGKKRAPHKIFTETDFYTISRPDGSRDLKIEHALSKVERGLKNLTTNFIARRRQLPSPQKTKLIEFIAAMHGRTPQTRDIQLRLWKSKLDAALLQKHKLRDSVVLQSSHKAAAAHYGASSQTSLDTLRKAIESPMQYLVPGAFNEALPALSRMTITVFFTDLPSFITSDCPVTWFDPTVPRAKYLTHETSLSDDGIEVTMPLSPRHSIMLHNPSFHQAGSVRYTPACPQTVSALNRRTAHFAYKKIVSWKDGFDSSWKV